MKSCTIFENLTSLTLFWHKLNYTLVRHLLQNNLWLRQNTCITFTHSFKISFQWNAYIEKYSINIVPHSCNVLVAQHIDTNFLVFFQM